MKAITFRKYGTYDELKMEEVDQPVPGAEEVLIRVHAASINPYDWHHLRGMLPIRFILGLNRPKNINILGADAAGTVVQVGENVSDFKPGDEVFGGVRYGAFAEYVCGRPEDLVHKPKDLSFVEAAAVPMVGYTALQSLRVAGIQESQQVLINGASGGIGTFAIQLAKYYGTQVTAVCSARNLDFVRSIGADETIDYTSDEISGEYDLVLDCVGNLSLSRINELLASNGRGAIAGFTNYRLLIRAMLFAGKRIKLVSAQSLKEDLLFLRDLLERKLLKPIVEKRYSMEELPLAMREISTQHARGKLIIEMNNH